MFLSLVVYADDQPAQNTNATDTQSSSTQAAAPVDDASISVANVHHINLDTTQVDGGGNWLNKRMWYERAQKVFDEIEVPLDPKATILVP